MSGAPRAPKSLKEEVALRAASFVEGDWIAVPLVNGYAVGRLVLRRPRLGTVFVCFLSGRFDELPTPSSLRDRLHADAPHALHCTDVPLRDDSWILLGGNENYQAEEWPLPWFRYEDPLRRRWWLLRAQRPGEADISKHVREVGPEEAKCYPRNMIVGPRQAERVLEELLPTGS